MSPVLRCHEITRVRHINQDRDDPLSDVRFGAVLPKDPPGKNAVLGKCTSVADYKAKIVQSAASKLDLGKAYYVDSTQAE